MSLCNILVILKVWGGGGREGRNKTVYSVYSKLFLRKSYLLEYITTSIRKVDPSLSELLVLLC